MVWITTPHCVKQHRLYCDLCIHQQGGLDKTGLIWALECPPVTKKGSRTWAKWERL